MKNRLASLLLSGAIMLPTMALPVVAQDTPAAADAGSPKPPTPDKLEDGPVVMNYFTMIIIIALVVGANLIPSKRGHQD